MFYQVGEIGLDSDTHLALYKGQNVRLTPLEFQLLAYLMQKPDRICSRDEIIDNVWGQRFFYDTGTIDVHLNALRRKLNLARNHPIETIRGVGILLHSDEPRQQYALTIYPFINEWLLFHKMELEAKGLVPKIQIDPFVSEITMEPMILRTMLDGVLAALLPNAHPGIIRIESHLRLTFFSLLLDINGTTNELKIPLCR